MNNPHKEFVPYAESMALKSLKFGFTPYLKSPAYYGKDKRLRVFRASISRKFTCSPNHLGADTMNSFEAHVEMMDNSLEDMCIAPLYQQAFRWFRNKHKMSHEVCVSANKRNDLDKWMFSITYLDKNTYSHSAETYVDYEEAELACLKKLIELVKQKNDGPQT